MDARVERLLADFEAQQRRRAFHSTERASNLRGQDESRGLRVAAANLLDKAERQRLAGDEEGALRFVRRALALPFDEHEEQNPALAEAHMRLFEALSDDFEDVVPHFAERVESLMTEATGDVQGEIAACIAAMVHDYDLSPAEAKRLRRLASSDWDADPFADVPADRWSTAVLGVLAAVQRFQDAADAES